MSHFYTEFARALHSPHADAPGVPEDGFAVYRNNVASSLINAMRAQFPATERLMGAEGFAMAALAFVRSEPLQSPLLFEIGSRFAAFLDDSGALSHYPFIPEVAALEYEMALAQHAIDSPTLAAAELAAIPEHDLAQVCFAWHPAARMIRTRSPAADICAQNRDGGTPATIADWRAQDILITRPAFAVDLRVLPPGGLTFLSALQAGETLGDAAELAAAASTDFQLAVHIAGLIASGCMAGLAPIPTQERHHAV